MPRIKLFNLDLHISVIQDFIYICNKLFPNEIEITSQLLSSHAPFVGKQVNNTYIINQQTWKFINQELIDLFYEKHKTVIS